jgi:predicted ATPase/signal transduction histidine kinase
MALKPRLDADWAVRPIHIESNGGEKLLLLEDPGAEPLDTVWTSVSTLAERLQIATAIAGAVGRMHRQGIVHRSLKPQNIFVGATRTAWLTGFGLATVGAAAPSPEFVSGTLPYIAPEQTGRLLRPIDQRSDLYSLGVILFELFTGRMPFQASDALGWVHCHIAEMPAFPEESDGCPEQIARIVARLLCKAPEERYHTAAGLEADLRVCHDNLTRTGAVSVFPVGERDTPARLAKPGTLYGRREAIAEIECAWRRVLASGVTELVLVSGTAGVGKSALLDRLRASVLQDGLQAVGKCDPQTQAVPYAVLTQALRNIVRHALGLEPDRAASWRNRLREALGANGKLMLNLMPGLEDLVGPLPDSVDLSPLEAKNRFDLLFADLLAAASSVDGPLLLILDDLQWIDRPSAALLERILAERHVGHLFIVGMYRGDEVGEDHDLHKLARAASSAGLRTTGIELLPLGAADVMAWLSDAIAIEPAVASALAHVVFRKTGGVPLSVSRFLSVLIEEELIVCSEATGVWTVDTAAAQGLAFTDNILSTMLGAMHRLPGSVQEVLRVLACLGGRCSLPRLADFLGTDTGALSGDLLPAVEEGLIVLKSDSVRFIHDRIREAAYTLVSREDRGSLHLALARYLGSMGNPDLLFETVYQFNVAGDAVRDPGERRHAADLNLAAARRSMEAMGHAAADGFLTHGLAFLGEQGRDEQPLMAFAFAIRQAECRMLTGDHHGAEAILSQLREATGNLLALAEVCRLQVDLFTMVGRFNDAVAVCMDYLRRAGLECQLHPGRGDLAAEARQLTELSAGRSVQDLSSLPIADDPVHAATVDLVTRALPAVLYTDRNLHSLLVLRMTVRTLQCGRTPGSAVAFIMLSRVLGPSFSDYDTGFRFARLGYDLMEAEGPDALKPIARLCFAVFCNSWMRPLGESAAILSRAIEAARACGDRTYTAYGHNNLFTNHIVAGTWLAEAQRVADDGLTFSRAAKFRFGELILRTQSGFAAALRGDTPGLTIIADSEAADSELRRTMEEAQCFELPLCWYWIRKLQACVISGNPSAALEARDRALPLLWVSEEFLEEAEFHLYGAMALSMAARAQLVAPVKALDGLDHHLRELRVWSATCPSTFGCRAQLAAAERASLAGGDEEALRLYEDALASARAGGFPNMQALIAEAAHRHHSDRRLHTAADAYLAVAREAYAQWGVSRKVDTLDAVAWPTAAPRSEEGMVQASWRSIDLSSVLQASQALSREILVDDVTRKLLRIVLEHSGGDRALVLLCRDGELRPLAEARKLSGDVLVATGDGLKMPVAYPETVARYVLRTRESILLNEPHTRADTFSQDAHIVESRPRSVLSTPLMKQGELIGVLYVENTLVSGVFTPSVVAMLGLLAPQVAISLENARLYADLLVEIEERQRAESALRASEAMLTLGQTISQTGSWRWSIATDRLTWSAQLYAIMGIDPFGPAPRADDILLHIHPDERAEILAAHAKAVAGGRSFRLEFRVVLMDGTTKHLVAIGQPDPDTSGADYVGVVMDVTERRQVDEALRETQDKLAHAGRLTTMGELTSSIAHEVNQPLAAMVANGNACLRWLDPERTNLARARETARRIVADGHRAGDIIASIRSMARNSPPARDLLDINTAVRDVVILLAGEAKKRKIRLDSLLAPTLRPVRGDRTQLQQVFVNLVMNGLEALETAGSSADERRLLVRTAADGRAQVIVTFEDNGPGVDPEAAARIFQPFFTTKTNGMGMGLAICQSIAAAHDGQLTMAPLDPTGTVFRLRLPVADH